MMRSIEKVSIAWLLRLPLHCGFRARSPPLAPAIVRAARVPAPSDPTPDRQTVVRHRAVALAQYRTSATPRSTYRGWLQHVQVSRMYRLECPVTRLSSVVDESVVRS